MSGPLRVLVADDEPLARDVLRRSLAALGAIALVGECGNGDELEAALDRLQPDVAFLDVRMPGTDVFEVLGRRLAEGRRLPCCVFTTAYDKYAVRAFELNAVDYLLKPFGADRLAEAVARARERLRSAASRGALEGLVRDLGRRPGRLLVPEGGRIVPVRVADIDHVRSEGDYSRLFSGGRSYLVSRGLTELEARLDPERFFRIHRTVIVNVERIAEVRPEGSGRYTVVLHDKTELPVSRTRFDSLKSLLL